MAKSKMETIVQYIIFSLAVIALLTIGVGMFLGKDTKREVVFRIEPSNTTIDNSTMAYANLYFQCIQFCYKNGDYIVSCSGECDKILTFGGG
jgi:hypothetical protein